MRRCWWLWVVLSSGCSRSEPRAELTAPTAPSIASPIASALEKDCDDARVVLVVSSTGERSGAARLRELLSRRQDFVVTRTPPVAPNEIEIYETPYGARLFADASPAPFTALVAACASPETCNRLGAVFRESSPMDRPMPSCGVPPLETPWRADPSRTHPPELAPAPLDGGR